jgi:hypothetical protein
VLPVGSFVLERQGTALVARTRDGCLAFDLMVVVAQTLSWQVARRFSMLAAAPHTPRVSFDRLVVSRESWSVDARELPFVTLTDELARFTAVRRWALASGMPRCVFVKAGVEKKPFYVDFQSPIYVNLLAKVARRGAAAGAEKSTLTISEMLPAADEAWLPDHEGRRYCCELRVVAVDAHVAMPS